MSSLRFKKTPKGRFYYYSDANKFHLWKTFINWMNMFVSSYSEINERTVWNGRFSKAWCCYTSIDWKCSSECMNLTGIPRSTSNTTAQSDGLLQKARSANKTQWFDRICRRKLRRTAFMQWNHHKIFEKFYESGVQVHENLHFKRQRHLRFFLLFSSQNITGK